MNTLTKEKLSRQFGAPEQLTDSYANAAAADAPTRGFKINNVLVAIRPSKYSADALKFAGWMASQFGCDITILHSTPPGRSAPGTQALRAEISRTTDLTANQVRAILIRQEIKDFSPITTAVRDEHADLIVIPEDFFKPSVCFWQTSRMEKLIHHAQCPVLIVGGKSMPSLNSEVPYARKNSK